MAIVFGQAKNLSAQTITPSGNTSYVGMEKNLLYHADIRYEVVQAGTRNFPVKDLFDGVFYPQYVTGFDGTEAKKIVIEISNLPNSHTQAAAFIGFTTRYLPPKAFKIEGYDVWEGYNNWRIFADVTNHSEGAPVYTVAVPQGSYTRLRFTFNVPQHTSGDGAGWIGLSELFFVHSEASKAFDGLMVQYDTNGNVGIGTTTAATEKLAVNGNVKAKEIRVQPTGWSDYVFETNYQNPSLAEIEAYIQKNKHLPEIPSAKEVEKEGIALGELNKLLLKKIEELTLHLIQLNKKVELLEKKK